MQRLPKTSPAANVLEHLAHSLDTKWWCYCEHFKRCRKKFSNKAVHDTRVSTRRLLSTLELLEPFVSQGKLRKVFKSLKEYLDGFDEVRDTHVQLVHLKEFKKSPIAKPFKKWLKKRDSKFSRKTHKAVRRFKTKNLARQIMVLKQEIRTCSETLPAEHAFATVMRTVNSMFAGVVQARNRIKPDDTDTIHCTRIPFKHFRYAVEELAPLLPAITKARAKQLHEYQSRMGGIQDFTVFLDAFDRFHCRKQIKPADAENFRDAIKHREQTLITEFLRHADQLNHFKL